MATSSILGGAQIPAEVDGKDMDSLGPSDTSDSGSDARGAYGDGELGSDSDAVGTGERASVSGRDRADADILPDRVDGEAGSDALTDSDPGGAGVEGIAADDDDPQDGDIDDDDGAADTDTGTDAR
ncbi:MAG: hypothetical protein JWQ72_493 [Polaromonas sp.]|nr:hypothetical protein [Polaromonas sp.]